MEKLRVYITDDDEDDQTIMQAALAEAYPGCELVVFNSCMALLTALYSSDTSAVNGIILDINLPQVDGLKCLGILKAHDDLKKIPVFIISSMRAVDSVNEYLDAGAINVYSKPNTFEEFKTLMQEMVSEMQKIGERNY